MCKDSAHNNRRKINVFQLLLEFLEFPTVTILLSKFKFCNKASANHTPDKGVTVTVCLVGATAGKYPRDNKLWAPVGVSTLYKPESLVKKGHV